MRHPAHSKHSERVSFLPLQWGGEESSWLGPIIVVHYFHKGQINELYENVSSFFPFIIPSSLFPSFPSFLFSFLSPIFFSSFLSS